MNTPRNDTEMFVMDLGRWKTIASITKELHLATGYEGWQVVGAESLGGSQNKLIVEAYLKQPTIEGTVTVKLADEPEKKPKTITDIMGEGAKQEPQPEVKRNGEMYKKLAEVQGKLREENEHLKAENTRLKEYAKTMVGKADKSYKDLWADCEQLFSQNENLKKKIGALTAVNRELQCKVDKVNNGEVEVVTTNPADYEEMKRTLDAFKRANSRLKNKIRGLEGKPPVAKKNKKHKKPLVGTPLGDAEKVVERETVTTPDFMEEKKPVKTEFTMLRDCVLYQLSDLSSFDAQNVSQAAANCGAKERGIEIQNFVGPAILQLIHAGLVEKLGETSNGVKKFRITQKGLDYLKQESQYANENN